MAPVSLPTVEPEWDSTRYDKLWAELRFRRAALFRVYPGAKMRSEGGPFWDMSGPSVAHVVIGNSVYYDHEMTLLRQAIDLAAPPTGSLRDSEDEKNTKPWPQHDHPVIEMNQYLDLLVACACDAETWARDDVQNIWMKLMGKQPLDELAKVSPEV